jgi:hypothetical protein
MNPFFSRLTKIHARLDAEVRSEHARLMPDGLRLLRLKKLRLVIKDRIHRLMPSHQKVVG